jgi:2'-5' RNA ligase
MRTFLAVEIPESVRKVIHDLIQIEAKKELPIKWVKFENLHITLKFLGEIEENNKSKMAPAIAEICQKHSPFSVQLAGLGCFPNPRNPRVVWVGVKQGGEELCTIAADLEEELARFGFKEEKRFHPHLTIGRIKKFCKVDDILTKSVSTDVFRVNSIVFFKSTLKPDGPIYEKLDRYTLR